MEEWDEQELLEISYFWTKEIEEDDRRKPAKFLDQREAKFYQVGIQLIP